VLDPVGVGGCAVVPPQGVDNAVEPVQAAAIGAVVRVVAAPHRRVVADIRLGQIGLNNVVRPHPRVFGQVRADRAAGIVRQEADAGCVVVGAAVELVAQLAPVGICDAGSPRVIGAAIGVDVLNFGGRAGVHRRTVKLGARVLLLLFCVALISFLDQPTKFGLRWTIRVPDCDAPLQRFHSPQNVGGALGILSGYCNVPHERPFKEYVDVLRMQHRFDLVVYLTI
jgi:hypothetical protein